MAAEQNREILLAPQQYAYMQKEGSGTLSVHVGPGAIAATQQDVPIVYDQGNRRYVKRSLDQAVQESPRAAEGEYVVLENPANDGSFPSPNSNSNAKELKIGQRIVIPGPWCEPLWPGQAAGVLEGHKLRTNQFLIAVVYNEKEAESNWDKTIIKAQTETAPVSATGATGATGAGEGGEEEQEQQPTSTPLNKEQIKSSGLPRPESFAVGTRIVIRGTDASFYIPCTGVEVVRDENSGDYVREAVTLERLEYCCLIDETGKKEYPVGPKVVFPKATQIFDMDSRKRRKWRAIELNSINGIHLKVVADFEGDDITKPSNADGARQKRKYKEGEELFVTGNELSIYYPREEFNIIEYGQGNRKHYSTAIPKGEGRYVINRETGEVRTTKGPKMLLCDPRTDIPVRRVLSPTECALWYPGNTEAAEYNRGLEAVMQESPSGRSGLVSEGDYRKSRAKSARRGVAPEAAYLAAADALESFGGPSEYEPEQVGDAGGSGGTITRGTRYTEQRTLTLDTKYSGVPRIEVWPGYAVLVVGSEGSRKVLEGPQVYLLEYDEKLGHMFLSTGKPKTTDNLIKTAYLQVQNNQVGDIVPFESADHVCGTVKISLRVNFEGESPDDKLRWFSVENYVKYLTDHVRSVIAGMAKRHAIADIKSQYVDLIRNAVLGEKGLVDEEDKPTSASTSRPGMVFNDNGMRVIEVEILDLKLSDTSIAQLLEDAQLEVVRNNIQLDQSRKRLETTKENERISQEEQRARHATEQLGRELDTLTIKEQLDLTLARLDSQFAELNKKIENELAGTAKRLEQAQANEEITDAQHQSKLEREKAAADQRLAIEAEQQKLRLTATTAETEAAVKRFEAAKEGLYEVLVSLGRDEMAAKLAEACTIERWLSGDEIGSSIGNLLSVAPTLKAFFDKAEGIQANGTRNRLRQPETADAT